MEKRKVLASHSDFELNTFMRAHEFITEKTDPKTCRSTKRLGRSDQSSCVSQGLRPHHSGKTFRGHPIKHKKVKGAKYGGPLPDYS